MNPIQDRHAADAVVSPFLDGVADIISIGLKLRTRPTRGVDRQAEAQFRLSYENQREELVRWMLDHIDEAAGAAAYEIAATLTDTTQDSLLDPKTRGELINLRKEYLEALPRVAQVENVTDLLEAIRVVGESGAYLPAALTAFATAMADQIRTWPGEASSAIQKALLEALPLRPGGRGRASGAEVRRALSEGRGSTTDTRPPTDEGGGTSESRTLTSGARPPEEGSVMEALFAAGPDAGRTWALLVAEMTGPPPPPEDAEILARQMSALPPQAREASCKRMRMALPDWCAACGRSHLASIGRSAPVAETLVITCRRLEDDFEFRQSVIAALPMLPGEAGGASPRTEPGLKAAGRLVEHLWNEALGDALAQGLSQSAHPRPGALRRLLCEDSPRLATHLGEGGPLREASWRRVLDRPGVPWADRLALPVSRIPQEDLLTVWTQEAEQDPATARGLLDVAREEASARPEAGALLVHLLERRPELTPAYLDALLATLAQAPHLLQERRRLAQALWDAVLARPEYLARLPEALNTTLLPMIPETIPPTREWASAFLRGPQWLRAHLRARRQAPPPLPDTERGSAYLAWAGWLEALLSEMARGSLPDVPDAAAAQIAALLTDALHPEDWGSTAHTNGRSDATPVLEGQRELDPRPPTADR